MDWDHIVTDIKLRPEACNLLVSPSNNRLEKMADEISKTNISMINLGQKLSEILLNIAKKDQPRAINQWFDVELNAFKPGPLVCTHIDLLFDPSFNLDPLNLFRRLSRTTQLIVLWPGDFSNRNLSYAVPEHHHYRTWRVDDPQISIQRLLD